MNDCQGLAIKKVSLTAISLAHNCPCPVPEKFIACHHVMEIAAWLAKEKPGNKVPFAANKKSHPLANGWDF